MMDNNLKASHMWSEDSSETFIQLANLFVPARAEQITSLIGLIPARKDDLFTVVELGAGAGVLAREVLDRFPNCHYLALDGSERMRGQMRQSLTSYGARIEIHPFELADQAWRTSLPGSLRCVLSSLCVHHLDAKGKRQLFADLVPRLAAGGALLLADVVEPASQLVADLYARQYDEIVQSQSLASYGDLRGYERFRALKWNYFAYDYGVPGSGDYPSLLSDQLLWLREAGFKTVDCFWLRAGHAIFGGYK